MPFDPDAYLAKKVSEVQQPNPKPTKQGFDPDAYLSKKEYIAPVEDKGMLQRFSEGIEKRFQAPLRAGIGAAQVGANPLTAAKEQYGKLEGAPSWQELGARAGLPENKKISVAPFADPEVMGYLPEKDIEAFRDTQVNIKPREMYSGVMSTVTDPVQYALSAEAPLKAVGKGVAKAGGALEGFLKGSGTALKDVSDVYAIKSSGAMLKDFRNIFNKGMESELAESMYKHKLIKPGADYTSIAEGSAKHLQDYGKKISDTYDLVNQAVQQKTADQGEAFYKALADKYTQKLSQDVSKVRPKIGAEQFDAKVTNIINDVVKDPTDLVDVKKVNDIIGQIDEQINWGKKSNELPAVQKGLLKLRQSLRDVTVSMADEVGKASGNPELAKQLQDLNKNYHHLKTINTMSQDRVAREAAKQAFGLIPSITTGTGAIAGVATGESFEDRIKNMLAGAALGYTGSKAMKYGLPIASQAARGVGSGLQAASVPASKLSLGSEKLAEFLGSKTGRRSIGAGLSASKILNNKSNDKK